ncbi:peptidylprolyl isomerase SurA [Vibrio sp. SM6]|uniref:Chaperone SurA n=1 Tax=Vibrio agarilyticus TaxID=2726741 RepID=A0A7X8TPQ3_9VIBR|nr:peptidylprolyl isomerase SurA [Vibrio agarilyticus]NLS12377.1 peptidylprolyl isomerase SurA [Vibrio agarilyticus]
MKAWKSLLLGLLLANGVVAAPVELDKVAVIVNDGVILQSDITTALKSLQANAKKQGQTLPEQSVLQEQILEKLIVDALQAQEAKRIGVRIDDERLNQTIASIAEQNQQTLAQLQASLASDGISYPEFREQIRKELALSEARNALVRRRINILPAEVDSLADALAQETNANVQYQVRHIQLRLDGQDNAALEQQAQDIITKYNQGEDFSTLAYTYSKGPKALEGGDWGWLRKEEMPTIFADQITTQGKGALIGPFRSGVGYHILLIEDVQGMETVAVTEANARHILIKPSVILSDEGAKQELNEMIRQINAGEATFGDLAAQHSQDPGSAARQGELGYQTPDLYVPEFKYVVETLPVGTISEPFKTVHGWHIVEVLDRRQVDRTDAAMKDRAYRLLFNRKFNEEVDAWLQELRAGAFIEVLGDNPDAR